MTLYCSKPTKQMSGFSQYCRSSLDLTNFVVRSCCGAVPWLLGVSLSDSLESENLGICKLRNLEILESGNLEIWKFGIQKIKK